MTPEQFCYWLQGFGELSADAPTPEQWQSIKEHLSTVFGKVTPPGPGQLGTYEDFIRQHQGAARKNWEAPQLIC